MNGPPNYFPGGVTVVAGFSGSGGFIAFIDECGDDNMRTIDPQFPVLVLAACLFDREYYFSSINPAIDGLKYKYWGHRAINLHSADIRRRAGHFAVLGDKAREASFHNDLNMLMGSLEYTVVAAGLHKQDHSEQYTTPLPPYDLTMEFIMERIYKHCYRAGTTCELVMESRGPDRDREVERVYERLLEKGNGFVRGPQFRKLFTGVRFLSKTHHENGLQLADLVAYPVARYVLGNAKDYTPFEIVKAKLDKRANGSALGYGLTVFPGRTLRRLGTNSLAELML